jgi:tetratricopeptide (TPR) repeat protein
MKLARPLFALVIFVLITCLGLPGTAPAQDSVARDYYLAGSEREAVQALKNMHRLHYEPALKALQARKYQYALGDLEFMLKYFPNHPQALDKIGEVALGLKRPDIAQRRFEAALERYPQHDETYVVYGTFLHRLGRVDLAIAQYQRALEINPNSVYGNYNLGLAYVDRKEYAQANVHAQKAYELGVTFPGLRKRLQAAGAWKPMEHTPSNSSATPPAVNQQVETDAK